MTNVFYKNYIEKLISLIKESYFDNKKLLKIRKKFFFLVMEEVQQSLVISQSI